MPRGPSVHRGIDRRAVGPHRSRSIEHSRAREPRLRHRRTRSIRHQGTIMAIVDKITEIAGLEEHLPPPDAHRSAQPRGGDAHQLLPAPAPGQRPQAGDRPELHLVHGRDDLLPVHRRDGHRRAADVLLPADARARLQRHPRPARRDDPGHPPRAASLGGARDGHRRLAAHVPRLPDRAATSRRASSTGWSASSCWC